MIPTNLRTRFELKEGKFYIKNLFVIICALMMLIAYGLMSPWVQFNPAALGFGGNVQLPQDIEIPEGFTLPQPSGDDSSEEALEGFEPPAGFELPESFEATGESGQLPQLPEGFELPEGFTPPQGGNFSGAPAGGMFGSSPGQFLVPAAAVIALALAIATIFRPRFNRLATGLTLLAGLAALAFYVIFFVQDALIPINIVDMATPGFWLGMVGSIGLVGQLLIPRPRDEAADDTNVTKLVTTQRRSGMGIGQNLSVAFEALLSNKLRSGLTMLGIIIGVASVVSLLAVGRGAQAAVTEQIQGTGLNLITISPGGGGGVGPGGGGGGGSSDTLTYNDAEAISEEIDGLTAVLPQYSGNLQVRSDLDSYNASVLGASADYASVRNIEVEEGRYFTSAEYNNNARVAVLGSDAAEELFAELNPIGRDIRIDGKRFEVVGVLEQQDSAGFGNNPNVQIQVPLTTAYRTLFDARATASTQNTVTSIVVAAENVDDVNTIIDDITQLLRERHRLDADEEDDFSILDQQQLLDAATTITSILTVLLGAIASVSLLVGGIGIMNIMLVSVTERTKEIGLRKAIGARRGHILQQFLIETIFLSVLGGILGVLLGVGIALLVNGSGLLNATITPDSIALGLGFSAIVGIFFGVYPANQAASLEPIEALRYE